MSCGGSVSIPTSSSAARESLSRRTSGTRSRSSPMSSPRPSSPTRTSPTSTSSRRRFRLRVSTGSAATRPACRVAREGGIPYLGICLGMHVAVSEFARHVVGLDGANSTEMDPETPYPVIDLLPEQKEVEDLGGTMRLGAQAVELEKGTRARRAEGETGATTRTHT